MKALILCAGKGERLMPLTENTPKPMLLIDNKPVLEYLILLCKKHGITEIAINTSHFPEKIKKYFGTGEKWGVKLHYSFEPELLGTSGALNNFKDFFDDTFFVIYGDNITDLNLTEMLEFHKKKENALATMYLYRESMVDEKTSIGRVVVDENKEKVLEIVENPNEIDAKRLQKIPEDRKLLNAGIYIMETQVVDLIPEGFSDFAKNILPKVLEKGEVYAYQDPSCYLKEIGQMMRYEIAKEDIESGKVQFDFINIV